MCTVADVTHAAGTAAVWGPTLAMPPMCKDTARFTRDAMACWSPTRHWLFHARVRTAVHTMLLVRQRLEALAEAEPACDAEESFPLDAPLEIWFLVCGYFLRRHWAVG